MGALVTYEQFAQYRDLRREAPELRVKEPQTIAYKLQERAPHERPIPSMPDILQPDTLDMLHQLQRNWMARYA
jgi:hypothetical protein